MKYKNLYEIRFETKQGGSWHRHRINLEAYNKREAVELAKQLWYEAYKPHMFSILCSRIPEDAIVDYAHWFVPA